LIIVVENHDVVDFVQVELFFFENKFSDVLIVLVDGFVSPAQYNVVAEFVLNLVIYVFVEPYVAFL